MKNRVFSILCVLAVLAVAGKAQEQTMPFKVHVPFQFVVGNQTFPAGTYQFHSLLNSVPSKASVDVLEVRSTVGRLYQAIVTDVVGSAEPNHPRLLFTRRGDRAFLSEVWEPGKSAGCRLHNQGDEALTVNREEEKVTLMASADGRLRSTRGDVSQSLAVS
jgi:hypothetical protein